MIKVNLKEKIGKGYKDFWLSKHRYLVCKGSRGSKKSTTAAQKIIYKMMQYPLANTLVIRKVFNTHKDSTWTQLKWATYNLNVSHLWNFSKSPLEATYLPTGQKIMFRGLDNPLSITSITVEKGYICFCWWEEAYQINAEDDFNKIDMSLRGQMAPGYYRQHIITFNPWSEKHWLKKRFFDNADDNTLSLTTNYMCNEWLGPDDIALFKQMKINNPRRYNIEGLGNWGIAEGLIYNNFIEQDFNYVEISKRANIKAAYGLDFGFSADPTAFIAVLVDEHTKEIYVYDEMYNKGLTNQDIAEKIKYKGYSKCKIVADSSEPKSIEELKRYGLRRIQGALKGRDSILNGIQFIQNYKIIVHPKCQNTLIELNNYVWDNKDGNTINRPIDDYNHILDALRYSLEQFNHKKALRVLNKSSLGI